ncbi:MAG TPA: RNA polymerase factor sigma-54 [Terriglobales bacterium]|nr:RNA polymerase factor sigma-54 [Terriglobales bacterium]
MVLLQPKLNLKVTQRQILTPGLVQMVSVLALNKLELKDMINAEIVENPVLEELDSTVPLIDDIASKEEERERTAAADEPTVQEEKKDPFDEIDFGSFFQDYLDPGYRSQGEMESIEKPSFENFLSRPSTLTDHLLWQLGSLQVREEVRAAAELVIGNLNEDGYLLATDEELLAAAHEPEKAVARRSASVAGSQISAGRNGGSPDEAFFNRVESQETSTEETPASLESAALKEANAVPDFSSSGPPADPEGLQLSAEAASADEVGQSTAGGAIPSGPAAFDRAALHEALEVVRQLDPVGVACRDLRECLLAQIKYHQQIHREIKNGDAAATEQLLKDCAAVINDHLKEVQNKQYKELAKAIGRPLEAVMQAVEFVKTLDPRPGLRYNAVQPRLIEPDVAFVKQGDEYLVLMNEDDVPQLRLNPAYRRLLHRDAAEKDVRNYVKERYKSAIQLIKNIEQRKQTILKVCYSIIARQAEFLDRGIDALKPMMIKEVAEEIGVHPSTVSRAVANKYAHTPQGVFELRYFFSESVNGPEGGATSLLILKRRVKKLIDDEDPARPLTDEQITRILQSQGIQVTRRTVAKYREDMRIPSTHQRRVKN